MALLNHRALQIAGASGFVPEAGASRALVNNLRRALQARMRTQIRTEQLSGRISKRALIRVALPPVDGGTWNSRIFYRKFTEAKLNTAVSVLVDCSGSMGGTKIGHAAKTACLLVNGLASGLRIPVEVLGHSASGHVAIGVFKSFSDRTATDQHIASRIYKFYTVCPSGNADADAILVAASRLKARREKRRVLIVLSDGSPSCATGAGCADTGLHRVIKDIRKRKEIEIYGIGIEDTNVRLFYDKDSPVVNKSSDIEKAVMDCVSKHIFV